MAEETKKSTEATDGLTPQAIALLPRVQEAIEEVRPALQADGGDIELLGITPDLKARVRLVGACMGCPSAHITLSMGVENYVRERVPEIQGVQLDNGRGGFGFGGFDPSDV